MELKWLEDFLCLVDTQNFSRAADIRNTTQPAFSRRIKSLEQWLGATLFDRSKQPIDLTPAGEQFRVIAEEVLRRLYQGREDIRQTGLISENTISFAATHSLSLTFFPNWIRKIEEQSVIWRTRLDSNQVSYCVHSLARGECHFMMSHTHPHVDIQLPDEFFDSIKVGEDSLLPVCIPGPDGKPLHVLPGSSNAPLPYLVYSETSAIGRAVEYELAHRADKAWVEPVFESHLAGVLRTMAREGRGFAWLPKSQIRQEMEVGELVPCGDESWYVAVDIRLFRSRDPLPQVAEDFWKLLADARPALS